MGTRTNFYKNPSFSYNKDFSLSSVLQNLRAYNVTTGKDPPVEEQRSNNANKACRKRRPKQRREPDLNREKEEECDGPFSHQSYIEKRRKEVRSSQAYEELTTDILGTSSLGLGLLVQYGSDESSTSEECEEKCDAPNSDHVDEVDQVKKRMEQRFPLPGEPVCVLCGKYGEYICNELEMSEAWTSGHLADDCLVTICSAPLLPSTQTSSQESMVGRKSRCIPRDLFALYRRKGAGLSIIRGSICCDEHFTWLNCMNADVEDSAYIIKKRAQPQKHVELSDFIF